MPASGQPAAPLPGVLRAGLPAEVRPDFCSTQGASCSSASRRQASGLSCASRQGSTPPSATVSIRSTTSARSPFFLFWIVAASGLYLYAFFDTGVTEAYNSIERITTGQFHVGLIMRGLHRYASDGMVVTMLLHMLRHFCFDRHRGFRWFSWVSGVLLLWLTYVSGINGYMLPWDRLAQFVVVGTAELLDWLPIFNGALVRNFIYQGSVKDRLFSLFSFIHIGVPLTLLLFMWIHIQRVPRASTNPPRAIAVPLLATLIALAVVAPVMSHRAGGSERGAQRSALRLVHPQHLSPDVRVVADRRVDAAAGLDRVAGPAALAAASPRSRPWLPHDGASGQQRDPGAAGRDGAGGRTARGHPHALRVPQRRLRGVQGHDPSGRGAARPLTRSRSSPSKSACWAGRCCACACR